MSLAKSAVSVLASVTVTAGSTKAAPGTTSSTVNTSTYYGAQLMWKITNGVSAPGTPLSLTFQVSPDGTTWYDYYTATGDVVASSINSGSLKLDRDVMNLRAIAYGNTTNGVTVQSDLTATTSL
jgi:hypothetical protein